MKNVIAVLSMLALLATAGGVGAQDKDKAPAKAATEAKAEPAKAEPVKAEAKAEEKKEEAKPAPTPTPTPNKGDVAWMLTSTALVLMMSVPALALFYGGMVRAKNMLS
ncbi:MAG: ammonia channel protein, partial [Betaproteobacteria bacterium]